MSTASCTPSSESVKPFECNELLGEFRDQPELVLELFRLFIDTTMGDIEDLSAALACRDARRVANIAHRLKGSAACIGAQPIRAEAERIEGFGLRGQLQPALKCMRSLHSEYERFCRYVAQLWPEQSEPQTADSSGAGG